MGVVVREGGKSLVFTVAIHCYKQVEQILRVDMSSVQKQYYR